MEFWTRSCLPEDVPQGVTGVCSSHRPLGHGLCLAKGPADSRWGLCHSEEDGEMDTGGQLDPATECKAQHVTLWKVRSASRARRSRRPGGALPSASRGLRVPCLESLPTAQPTRQSLTVTVPCPSLAAHSSQGGPERGSFSRWFSQREGSVCSGPTTSPPGARI